MLDAVANTHPLTLAALCADLATELPRAVRLQRLVDCLRSQFACAAVGLLRLEHNRLQPVAVSGLVNDTLGRRFMVAEHPRLAAILARQEVSFFESDSTLPDPYDGLVESHLGAPLPVHDCMGVSLRCNGQVWGVLTLDALVPGTFDALARERLHQYLPILEAVVHVAELEQELRTLRLLATSAPHNNHPVSPDVLGQRLDIVGDSPALQQLLRELTVVAGSDLPVLLLGETGVGKELFGHLLHQQSGRRNGPMVHVNCAALPESLAESELFGHVRGAFSGAVSDRPGRFEAAEGGTLFLDEVGELPLAVQAKLLRALQNGEIQRLGTDQPRRVNVRVVAATNRKLREQVAAGTFRADLYHRLSVYPVAIPPLRERGRDVLLLAGRFLELNRSRLGLRSLRLSPGAQNALLRYPWPGNVRELEHVISRAALKALSRGAQTQDIVTLETALLDLDGANEALPTENPDAVGAALPPHPDHSLREAVDLCQRQSITQALQRHQGNWVQAARALDIDPSNLHKLARRLGLKSLASMRTRY